MSNNFSRGTIYELLSGLSKDMLEARFEGKGYAEFKQELADIIIENLKPLQFRYRELIAEPAHINYLLTVGVSKVRPVAEKILTVVKDKVGLG